MLLLLLLAAAPEAPAHLANANALLDREADPWAYEQARTELVAALAAAPEDDAVQVAHARWLRREGQLDQAKAAIEAVRNRSPSFVPALLEEGELALERDCQNGRGIAYRLANAALDLAPDEPRAWLLLARTEAAGWGPRFDLIRHADKLRHSDDAWVAKQAEWLLADVYEDGVHQLNRSALSERCYLWEIGQTPRRPDARAHYATWLLHRGRYEEAANQASKALELGVFVPARHTLAVALRKQAEALELRHPDAARELLVRSVESERSDDGCEALARLGGTAPACTTR